MCAKNTDTANIDTKGFCHYKFCNGIKRHILVDVLGNPFFVHCSPANMSDDDGMIEMIILNIDFFKQLPPNHNITLLLDNGYHTNYLETKLKEIYPDILTKITIKLSPKITPEQKETSKKENPDKQGFVVIAQRWIVERTNAWINQCRVLWKNCEGLLTTSVAKIKLCSIRLILRRLRVN